jgi:hypothetical protein
MVNSRIPGQACDQPLAKRLSTRYEQEQGSTALNPRYFKSQWKIIENKLGK